MTAAPPREPIRPSSAPVPSPWLAADPSGGISAFQRLGYSVLILFLFLIFSRIFDIKFYSLHIPGISYRVIFVMVLLSRAFIPVLKGGIGRAMGFYALWFTITIVTSMWRRGSYELFMSDFVPATVIFVATAGLVANLEQCRRAVYTVGLALFALTLVAVFWGSTEETGRLFLPHGKFSNPNEMGQALLLGMPLWWLIYQDSSSLIRKAFAGSVMFLMLVMVSKTGSRGAMIAFAGMVFFAFLRASITGKLKLIVGGVVILGILISLMPGKLLRRYTSLTEDRETVGFVPDDYDEAMDSSAVASTQARRELLTKSIKFTIRHPLFGVGPGMFPVAEDADAHDQGKRKGMWQGTHNSYTQVSSELGIPGLIAYVCVIFLSLKKTSALYKRTRDDPRLARIANCAIALHYCLVVYAISVFFDYIAYTSMLSVLAGLAAALDATAPAEIGRLTANAPAPQPVPFQHFRPRWRATTGVTQQA